jgi:hypothetical protein
MNRVLNIRLQRAGTILLAGLLLCAVGAIAQTGTGTRPDVDSIIVPITAEDMEHHSHTIVLGLHTRATDGFNLNLGERPIPPVPPVPVLDVRFLDPTRRRTDYPGLDSYVDLRPMKRTGQVDTFYVGFRPADEAYPVRFLWNVQALNRFDRVALLYAPSKDSILTIDMKRQGMAELGGAGLSPHLIIITNTSGTTTR